MATQLKNLKFSDMVAEMDDAGNLGHISCDTIFAAGEVFSVDSVGNVSCNSISPTYLRINGSDYSLIVDENGFVKVDGGGSSN